MSDPNDLVQQAFSLRIEVEMTGNSSLNSMVILACIRKELNNARVRERGEYLSNNVRRGNVIPFMPMLEWLGFHQRRGFSTPGTHRFGRPCVLCSGSMSFVQGFEWSRRTPNWLSEC